MRVAAIASATWLALAPLAPAAAQAVTTPPEVRQLVTFLFLPGKAADALGIYESALAPIYRDTPELLRFRAFREVESPEPLDLVIASSYAGMEGMERAAPALRRPAADGRTALHWYGALSALSQHHHDQFVEMVPTLSDTPHDAEGLIAFEYLQVVPGRSTELEAAIRAERSRLPRGPQASVQWSETGRMLVADRWTHLRIHGMRGLADWQLHLARRKQAAPALDPLVAARKVILVRGVPSLAIR
ncbi:MAG: hypothetical protein JNJ98_07575 [Gemmatimonadetes bacterium]|nr:hypothetical protein [Gemmatimonadota bacterium]